MIILRVAACLLLLAIVSGCVDRGDCLESHMQMVMVPMQVGKVTIMRPQMRTVCDRWQYPDGRQL